MRVLRFLWAHSGRVVALAVVAGVVSGASSTGLLALINIALGREDAVGRGAVVAGFVALCLVVPTTRVLSQVLLTHLGQRTVYELRMRMSRRILGVPLRHLETLGAARLIATLTGDIPAITGVITAVPLLCINVAVTAGCLIYLGWLSWKVLLVVSVLIVVGVVSYQLPVARAMRRFRAAREERDDLFSHFRALTEGTKELKLHQRRRDTFLDRVLAATAARERHHQVWGQGIYTVAASWGQLLVFVVIGVVLFGLPVLGESPTRETLTGYALILLYLMTPLQMIMNALPNLGQAEVALQRVEEMGLDLDRHATERVFEPAPAPAPWQKIELRGVKHVYRREDDDLNFVVGPIDLELRPGDLVFLAGGNGSGKTTLAKVLVGLYPPHEGEVLVAGSPVTDDTREAYRQLFSAVFSDFYLFDSLLGLESPELDARARRYLEELRLAHKVAIEDGRLSDIDLSQGQRKRLALLTAYLEDRPVYVFDEWAADQDPTFRDVFYLQILPELKRRGKAVVVISHDDRYYGVGDRVVWMEYGKIVEQVAANPEAVARTP